MITMISAAAASAGAPSTSLSTRLSGLASLRTAAALTYVIIVGRPPAPLGGTSSCRAAAAAAFVSMPPTRRRQQERAPVRDCSSSGGRFGCCYRQPLHLAGRNSRQRGSSLLAFSAFSTTGNQRLKLMNVGSGNRRRLLDSTGSPAGGGGRGSGRTTGRLSAKNGGRRRGGDEPLRADRVLSNRSGLSRSECFQLLKQKRVFYLPEDVNADDDVDGVDGSSYKVVPGPSSKLTMRTPLRIDRGRVVPMPPPLLRAYHKPKWVLSVRSDPQGRPCLDSRTLPPELCSGDGDGVDMMGKSQQMHPVGRLDYDTSGLLLFSASGGLTQTLLHPKHEITKEYRAVVTVNDPSDDDGRGLDVEKLRSKLENGVKTGEGVHTAALLDAVKMDRSEVPPYLLSIREGLPPEYNVTDLEARGLMRDLVNEEQDLWTVRLEVSEGKHRMVRRMLANCGNNVISLHRVRFGEIELDPEDTPEGTYRELTPDELQWAESLLPSGNKKGKSKSSGSSRSRKQLKEL